MLFLAFPLGVCDEYGVDRCWLDCEPTATTPSGFAAQLGSPQDPLWGGPGAGHPGGYGDQLVKKHHG